MLKLWWKFLYVFAQFNYKPDLDERSYEFFEEVLFEQIRPIVMNEVDEKSFDMWSILILISHDHYPSIAQPHHRLRTRVFLLVLQADDLDNVVYLSILHDLQRHNKHLPLDQQSYLQTCLSTVLFPLMTLIFLLKSVSIIT